MFRLFIYTCIDLDILLTTAGSYVEEKHFKFTLKDYLSTYNFYHKKYFFLYLNWITKKCCIWEI